MKSFIRSVFDQIAIFTCLFICLAIGLVGIPFYLLGLIGRLCGKVIKKILNHLKQFAESSNTLKQEQKEELIAQLKNIE